MDEETGVPGQTLDNFSHYQYAPSSAQAPPQNHQTVQVMSNHRQSSENGSGRNSSSRNDNLRNEMTTSISHFESPKLDNNSSLPDVAWGIIICSLQISCPQQMLTSSETIKCVIVIDIEDYDNKFIYLK